MNPTEANAEPTSETSPGRPRRRIPRRIRIAEWLAFAGLIAACLAAIGPAEKLRTTYSWPPPALPSGTPDREWYTPLLLAAQVPEMLSVDVPCQTAPALRDASEPVTVLATSRSPQRAQRFAITRSDSQLTYAVGDTILARVPVGAAIPGCLYRIRFEEGRWSLSGGAEEIELGGDIGYMPVVSGLVSELDLRDGPSPSAMVTSGVHGTRTTTWQAIGWAFAALASIVALVLVSFARLPRRPWMTLESGFRRAIRALRWVDAAVGVSLVAWWVLSPVFYDDGWTIARQRGFASSRGFSTYYNGVGTNLPNDYWLDWLQHWITQSFDPFLILRIPPLLCLAAIWALCRWTLNRVVPSGTNTRDLPEWVLALTFLTAAMAWGMTLRPEPIIAVLVTGTLVCAVWFSEGGGARPLAFLAVLIPLAITGHHTGVVAFATLVVISGPVLRWARRELAIAVAIATSALALLVTLAFIGSDIAQRADDADATRVYGGVAETWRDEAARYSYLSVTLFANPVRRGSVALIGLAVLAFVLRRRRERTPLDLASASLAVALVLLIATPSKWPWHFGALIGIAAVAVASETVRLRRDAEARGWSARPFVVVGAALLALVWASGIRQSWNADDLRSLDWTLSSSWFSAETIALGFGLLLAGAVFIAHRRARPLTDVPWQFATRAALVVTLPVTVFAIGMLVIDAAKTDAWTLTRQNLLTLRGDSGCGFADELLVPDMGSVRALSSVNGAAGRAPAWLPPPPIDGVDGFALGPVPGGPVESPWYELSSDRAMGVFVSGGPGPTNALSLEWGRSRRDAVRSYGRGGIGLNDAFHDERALPWRFVLASELPQVPEDADAVRVVLEDRTSSGIAIGVTSPVSYTSEKLAGQLSDGASSSLVHPTVVPYFPCARQPTIRNGVAQPPDRILGQQGALNPVVVIGNLSPFMGLLDMYPLERLSLADSQDPPTGLLAFGVVKRIPGAIEAPPNAATTSS